MNINNVQVEHLQEITKFVRAAEVRVEFIKSFFDGKEVTAELEERLLSFDSAIAEFYEAKKSASDYDYVTRCALNVAIFSIVVSDAAKKDSYQDPEVLKTSERLREDAVELQSSVKNRKRIYTRATNKKLDVEDDSLEVNGLVSSDFIHATEYTEANEKLNGLMEKLDNLRENLENAERKSYLIAQDVENNSNQINALVENLPQIQQQVTEQLKIAKDLIDTAEKDFNLQKEKVDGLVAKIAEGVIAGDYKESAALEKGAADKLRWGSLFCMGLIIITVAYSFYETVVNTFDWENSIFRLLFSVVLSVPAAYLARESTKHRLQHYSHLQMALDMKAIDPYLSSIPEDERHRLKAEMASRLFGAKDGRSVKSDSYPINSQELILAIIDKFDSIVSSKKKEN